MKYPIVLVSVLYKEYYIFLQYYSAYSGVTLINISVISTALLLTEYIFLERYMNNIYRN